MIDVKTMIRVFSDMTGPPLLPLRYHTNAWVLEFKFLRLLKFSFADKVGQEEISTAGKAPDLVAALSLEIPAVVRKVMDENSSGRVKPLANEFFCQVSAIWEKGFNPFLPVVQLVRIHDVLLSRSVQHNFVAMQKLEISEVCAMGSARSMSLRERRLLT